MAERKGDLKKMNSPHSHLSAESGNVGNNTASDTGGSERRKKGSFYTWHKLGNKTILGVTGANAGALRL